jgi:L,D-transpeptidase YcbB
MDVRMNLCIRAKGALAALIFATSLLTPPAFALAPEALKEGLDRPSLRRATDGQPNSIARAHAMRGFYEKRGYRPIWFAGSRLSAHGTALLGALSRAADHGLDPAKYDMPQLGVRAANPDVASHPDVEVALTLAYLAYAADVTSGVVDNPRAIGRVFRDVRRPAHASMLDGIAGASNPVAFLERLSPDTRRYNALKAALGKYRQIERSGGWAAVDKGAALKPGARGLRVAQIKRRLAVTGDLVNIGDIDVFDAELSAAVRKFQSRHGLRDDGSIGPDTIAEMNVPVKDRIEQIVINLERRRWLAPYLGDRYIYLNIADNDVKVVINDRTIHVARVVVGKPFQQTPVFSALMTQIEINPYWNVPRSIAVNELLPIFSRNPGYAAANDYVILGPYSIRQKPGPKNALGTIAFRFPNPYNVYLHDTPAKNLFEREARYFSHGCMRVEFPTKLALLLLANQDGGAWTEQRINAVIATRVQTFIDLKAPIPVHITYLTAWAERDGTVHFRPDAYRRDPALKQAMRHAGAR